MFKVSQSKVKTWRRCRRAYHYKYVEKLRRKRKSRPLLFGSMVHQMIEANLVGKDPFEVLESMSVADKKMFAAEKAEYGELIQDVGDIMEEYFNTYEDDPLGYVEYGGRAAEHTFEIELFPDIIWNGKIDAIARDNLTWLVEHKTFNRKPTDDDRWRNLQSVSYFRAIEILGWESVDGTCWDYVWSKPPAVPGLLKDGSMSQKNIDSLPNVVRRSIKGYELKPRDYKAFLARMETNREKWFSRVKTPVDSSVASEVFSDFESSILEMSEWHGKKKERNIERHCTWCDFEPLCRARLQGLDSDYVKEREYETNSKKNDDEEVPVHTVTLAAGDKKRKGRSKK